MQVVESSHFLFLVIPLKDALIKQAAKRILQLKILFHTDNENYVKSKVVLMDGFTFD